MLATRSVAARSAVAGARPSRTSLVCNASASSRRELVQRGVAAVAAGLLLAGSAQALTPQVDMKLSSTKVSPIFVSMEVYGGLKVKPASEGLQEGTGHFHIIIDDDTLLEEGTPIPFDDTHLHYGKGQTTAYVALPKGRHTLTLQFADAEHKSYGPRYAKAVRVDIKGAPTQFNSAGH